MRLSTNRRSSNHANFETNPIILSPSEDGLELDTSDIEIEKIANKYSRRRNSQRNERLMIIIGACIVFFFIATIATFNSVLIPGQLGRKKNTDDRKVPIHPEFSHLRSEFLPDYQASMHHYRHKKNHAEFIAYIPIDKNQDKAFGISFRTKPTSDNGVAHILEHSVLSGSKKYPVKDPFVYLRKGSLNTFLNAMTYNDRTVYPIASRNAKDFHNLMSVYLDAVFFPNCVEEGGEWILRQEGWRYDFDDSGTISTNSSVTETTTTTSTVDDVVRKDIVVKGVVYSEMKGALSDPEQLLYMYTDKNLYPDNTYSFVSGGDPEHIPSLTQAEFNHFYKKHYHPTNAQIFVSGTFDDVESSMDFIDSEYLSKFSYDGKVKEESKIEYQKKKFVHHLYQSRPYAVSEEKADEGQHLLCITWLLNDSVMKETLELSFYVLDYLLMGTTSAPLYKSLVDSGLGSDVIGGGFGSGLLQSTFAVGMKGVKASDVADLEDKILNILREIEKDGFEDDDIQAAMNTIEFQLREVHSDSNPLGISVFLALLRKWNYDQDPFSALEFESALQSLKSTIKRQGSSYFQTLIHDYLLKNNHRVHMELRPSETLEATSISTEKKKMETLKNTLSQSKYESIAIQSKKLKVIQETDDPVEAAGSIPSLSLQDIDRKGVEYPLEVSENVYGTGATLITHNIAGSPGIVYMDVGLDISSVPFSDMGLLPLLKSILYECDTKSYSRAELDRQTGLYTGGISLSFAFPPLYDSNDIDASVNINENMKSYLFIRGKCTVENTAKMIELFKEIILNNVLVPQEKVIQIIERKISSYRSNIASSGHVYTNMRMNARYDVQDYISERLDGISQYTALLSILDKATNNWDNFKNRLSKTLQLLSNIDARNTVINLTGDEDSLAYAEPIVKDFISSLKKGSLHAKGGVHPWIEPAKAAMSSTSPLIDEGIVVSSRVSYVGKAGSIYDAGEVVSGSSCIPLEYLKKGYLWDEVRAKNGAYGVMAQLGRSDGILSMVSYRDPNVLKTLDVYDHAADYIQSQLDQKAITQAQISTAIIGCIKSLESTALPPRSAGWVSFSRYLSNSSAARRQKWRDGILGAKKQDFKDFAERLKKWKNTSIAVVSSDTIIKGAVQNSKLSIELIDAN